MYNIENAMLIPLEEKNMRIKKRDDTGIYKVIQPPDHLKKSNMRTQNPIKTPRIIPSLLLFAPIFPIKEFTPGIWPAAPTIRRLMLARVSPCKPKLSFTE